MYKLPLPHTSRSIVRESESHHLRLSSTARTATSPNQRYQSKPNTSTSCPTRPGIGCRCWFAPRADPAQLEFWSFVSGECERQQRVAKGLFNSPPLEDIGSCPYYFAYTDRQN